MINNQVGERISAGTAGKQPREITVSLQDASVQIENHQIWSNADINVEQGEFIAVVGPNGSGKSTLFRVLLGLQPLSKGHVRVLGETPRTGETRPLVMCRKEGHSTRMCRFAAATW
jgi:ABC-type molybdenum transport system ATPase subunit/photorepair protein PhrA